VELVICKGSSSGYAESITIYGMMQTHIGEVFIRLCVKLYT